MRRGMDEAHSGCVALGLERWMLAYLTQFGANKASWPFPVKCKDGTYLRFTRYASRGFKFMVVHFLRRVKKVAAMVKTVAGMVKKFFNV